MALILPTRKVASGCKNAPGGFTYKSNRGRDGT